RLSRHPPAETGRIWRTRGSPQGTEDRATTGRDPVELQREAVDRPGPEAGRARVSDQNPDHPGAPLERAREVAQGIGRRRPNLPRPLRGPSPPPSPTKPDANHAKAGAADHQPRLLRRRDDPEAALGLGAGSAAGGLLVLVLDRRELEAVLAFDVDLHGVATSDLSAKQVLRQLVVNPARDHAPERPRTVDAVVALLGQQVLRSVCDLDRDLLLDELLAEP